MRKNIETHLAMTTREKQHVPLTSVDAAILSTKCVRKFRIFKTATVLSLHCSHVIIKKIFTAQIIPHGRGIRWLSQMTSLSFFYDPLILAFMA